MTQYVAVYCSKLMDISRRVNLRTGCDSTLDLESFIHTSLYGRIIRRLINSLIRYVNQNSFKMFIIPSEIK
jgi:hypothetical protein